MSSTADGAQMTVVAQETAALKVTLFQVGAACSVSSQCVLSLAYVSSFLYVMSI